MTSQIIPVQSLPTKMTDHFRAFKMDFASSRSFWSRSFWWESFSSFLFFRRRSFQQSFCWKQNFPPPIIFSRSFWWKLFSSRAPIIFRRSFSMQVLYFSTACFGTQFRLDINTNSFHAFAKHIKQSLLALYPTHYILAAFVVQTKLVNCLCWVYACVRKCVAGVYYM